MEFKNLIKFYLDEHGKVDKTEDTSFIVSGSENETALEVLIANTETTPTDIVVYASFKRADGFAISNRSLDFKGVTEDSKYYDFLYTFKNDRILDIAGQLEVSFTIKSGSKTINSVSNALYVRRNVKSNLETTTEEEFYQEAIEIVEKAQQDINQHRIESEAKFNTKVDKVNNANQVYVTDESGNQTTLTYSKNFTGGTIVQRNDDGQIDVKDPTENHQAVNKGYADTKYVSKSDGSKIVYATDSEGNQTTMSYSVGSTVKGNAIVVRDEENRINVNDPINETHAVNKRFADNTYVNKNIVSYATINDTIPMRDSQGRLNAGYPKERSHVANRAYVEDELNKLIGLAPEELDTIQELAEAFLAVGIKAIQGVLTEDQVYDLWNTQVDGRYNITSQKYGMEIIIIQHVDGEGKPLFKRMTGGYDYTYDFTLEGWVIASGGGGGTGGGSTGYVQLTSISEQDLKVAKGGKLTISFSVNMSVGKKGSLQIKNNDILMKSMSINNGDNHIDVSDYLIFENNALVFIVSDSIGNTNSLTYSIKTIELYLKSNFNDIQAYTGTIDFRYTPFGDVGKNIEFYIDNNKYGETDFIESSEIQQSKIISGLTHGVHKLEVKASAYVSNNYISSEPLTYNIIYYETGNDTILISSKFNKTNVEQGELISIDYVIYNPTASTSTVNLYINNEAIYSNLTQENNKKYFFNSTDYPYGNVEFKIEVNGVSKVFNVNVKKSEIEVNPIPDNLQLYLSGKQRTNESSEDVRNKWTFNDITANLIDFNYSTNGWLKDKNNLSVLRFNGKATTVIPFNLFEEDFLTNGKTIEFEFATTDVYDINKELVRCYSNQKGFIIKPNSCILQSNESLVETKFKEDEKVRISFVIQKRGEMRLIKTFINGVVSGLVQYPVNDTFIQSNPVGIEINGEEGSIDIYSIRVYGFDLTDKQVLDNYIADMPLADKIQAYNRNNIMTSAQKVSYGNVKNLIPVMTIIGELPTQKLEDDDVKPIVKVLYQDPFNNNNNFEYSDVEINVQGTSSKDFPRKNYKLKFPVKFSFYEGAIPEKTYTMKADYMESSHSHNTGNAIIMNNLSPMFPTQEGNSAVRNAIYGFPIVIFNQKTDTSEPEYYGVFNFNNDKGNSDTIGLTTEKAESWEFKNNTSLRCTFRTDDFSSGVADDFEARYPKDNTNYTNLQRVVSWVNSTTSNLNKFKSEFEQYFNLNACLFYYVMMDVILAVDSRAKNMFLDTVDGNIWYPRWYDIDTAYGLDNEGHLRFSYNLEQTDKVEEVAVYNGNASVLWNNFGEAFKDEIASYYRQLRERKTNKLSYETLMSVLEGSQINKISEAMYNTDGKFKYIDIANPDLTNKPDASRFYVEQGSRLNHLQWWLKNRFNYLDSKYNYQAEDDFITMRAYTPDTFVVTPTLAFELKPYTSMYLHIDFASATGGSDNSKVRAVEPNMVYTVNAPQSISEYNNTEIKIYNASELLDVGDLSTKYARTMDFHYAKRLKQLKIGNGKSGYKNTNLNDLTIGNLTYLEYLDVQNCPNLTSSLDLTGCLNIKEVLAKGSGITGINLAEGGNLTKLELPATIKSLTLVNQPFLSTLSLEGYSNITQLRLENVPLLNEKLLLQRVINNVEFIRLTDINWQLVADEQTLLDTLMTKHGLNNKNEVDTGFPYLSGNIHFIGDVAKNKLKKWQQAFPFVNFTYDNLVIINVTITWKNYLGNDIFTTTVEAGDNVTFPDSEPTKPDDVQYKDYVFTGWLGNDGKTYGNTITNVTTNLTLTPQFEGTLMLYDVYWYNGDILLEHDKVPYGATAEYNGSLPTVESGEDFVGWGTNNFIITGETYFYAKFDKVTVIKLNMTDATLLQPTLRFSYGLNGCSVKIDWGDGDITEAQPSTGQYYDPVKPNPYPSTGEYTIKINFKITDIDNFNNRNRGDIRVEMKENSYKAMITEMYFTYPFNIFGGDATYYKNLKIVEFDEFTSWVESSSYSQGCTGSQVIERFIFPKSASYLINAFFQGCENLKECVLPDNIASIGNYTFYNCRALQKIDIPDSVTSIGDNAFGANISLIEVNINTTSELTTIGGYAFSDCQALPSILIPEKVTSMGDWAFSNGLQLKDMNLFPTTPPSIGSRTLHNHHASVQYRVPKGSLDSYKNATNWNAKASQIVEKEV